MAHPGNYVIFLETVRKFHRDVRGVAILMCDELRLEPLETISVIASDPSIRTPYEIAFLADASHLDPHNEIRAEIVVGMDTRITVQRWETYRHAAAMALAGWHSVHKHALLNG